MRLLNYLKEKRKQLLNISKDNKRKLLLKLLTEYQKENVCEHASRRCKTCTFEFRECNTVVDGCALNLVIAAIELELSNDKETAHNQYNDHYFKDKKVNLPSLNAGDLFQYNKLIVALKYPVFSYWQCMIVKSDDEHFPVGSIISIRTSILMDLPKVDKNTVITSFTCA